MIELLRLGPTGRFFCVCKTFSYSLEHRRKVLPYKDPTDFELVVKGLRKAAIEP